ncbi:BTAD domain-containing putative transcriptional regulator [Micromonospora sonneratiae]|uniref:BTAD domain-containing putative transcriptional regulator n=1 Tax=Micromonospora sonneratiae TaxID=1184706 RepID=A0ABW3Y8C1_9ACTN
MRFNLLGTLTVESGVGQAVPLGSRKQRQLLAMLLLWPNETVGSAQLVAALWGDEAPASASANLRTYVFGLRRLLDVPDTPPRIVAGAGGYLLRVGQQERDVDRFDAAAARGRACLAAGDAAAAQAELTVAVSMWRGGPLADVPLAPPAAGRVAALTERYLLAEEDLAEVTLRLGDPADAVRRLRVLLERHPLRQRAWEQLMLGLHRLGDIAGALNAFHTARRMLAEQTGLDPGPRLRRLHDDILHQRDLGGPATMAPGSTGSTVHDLPPAVEPFVGRTAEIATVRADLEAGIGAVVALHGPGGVGKSALAVHLAHLSAPRFPDGVFYLDLRGAEPDPAPARPVDAIGRLLRAFSVPGGVVPMDETEASAAYRRYTAGRRILVILDNAHTAAQVAALLPVGPTSAAIITSRRHLATLPRGRHLPIDVLPTADAIDLLGRAGAGGRVGAEPAAADRLALLCGHLPLALRVAAARLASRPGWSLAAFADRLADPARRLDELSYDDLGVRRTLRMAYEALSEGDAHERLCAGAFRLIGDVPLTVVSVGAVAALLGRGTGEAHPVVETLADQRLLEPRQPGRYEMHDLLRLLAGEQAQMHESPAERTAALQRLVETYIVAAERATALANAGWTPTDALPEPIGPWQTWPESAVEVSGWLDTEHLNIVAAVTRASDIGGEPARLAVNLAWLSYPLFWRGGYPAEALALIDRSLALTAALALDTEYAVSLYYRAKLRQADGDPAGAQADLLAGAEVAEGLQDHLRLSAYLDALGNLHYLTGEPVQALRCHERALTLRRQHGTPLHLGGSLSNMADAQFDAGQPEQALAGTREALRIARRIGATGLEGAALAMLGQLECRAGDHAAAERTLTEAMARTAATGDLPTQCEATLARCAARLAGGRPGQALDDAVSARDLASRIGDRYLRAVAARAMAVATTAAGDAPAGRRLAAEAGADLRRLRGYHSPMYASFFGR